MSQVIQIDLNKNKPVADVVADLQPGDEVEVICTIKAKDDQTLSLELVQVVHETDEEEAAEEADPNNPENEKGDEMPTSLNG